MHHDNLGINDMCSWATPNPTPTYTAAGDRRDARPAPSKSTPASSAPVSTLAARMRAAIKRSSTPIPFVVTTPMPHTYVSKIPRLWDVRDVAGGSFSTVNLNQHNPKYCGRYCRLSSAALLRPFDQVTKSWLDANFAVAGLTPPFLLSVTALKWRETRRSLTSTCHPSASICIALQAHAHLILCTQDAYLLRQCQQLQRLTAGRLAPITRPLTAIAHRSTCVVTAVTATTSVSL
jgi:hypothetical protein